MNSELNRIWWLMKNQRVQESEPEIRKYISQHPDDSEGHAALGICLSLLKKHSEAIVAAKQALSLAPDSPNYHSALGEVYLRAGKLDLAESSFLKSTELDPENAAYYGLLAQNYWLLGKPLPERDRQRISYLERGVEAAYAGLDIDPENYLCLLFLIKNLVWLDAKKYIEECSELCQELLSLNPENANAHELHAVILYHQVDCKPNRQQVEQILTVIDEALRLNPNLTSAKIYADIMLNAYYARQMVMVPRKLKHMEALPIATYSISLLTLGAYNIWGWQSYITIACAIAAALGIIGLVQHTRLRVKASRHPRVTHYLQLPSIYAILWGAFILTWIVGFAWQFLPWFLKAIAAICMLLISILLAVPLGNRIVKWWRRLRVYPPKFIVWLSQIPLIKFVISKFSLTDIALFICCLALPFLPVTFKVMTFQLLLARLVLFLIRKYNIKIG